MKKPAKKRSGSKMIRPSYNRPVKSRRAPVKEERLHDLLNVVEAEAVFDEGVAQDAVQVEETFQDSHECIIIRDSEDVTVHTTNTHAAVNLQAALQLAIAVILSITIGDSPTNDTILQELTQRTETMQMTRQKLLIENSSDVHVTTTDTDAAVNIQLLLQVLLALVVRLDVL
ncbi:spore coat protein [Tumebacillus flagellatus]|uniref:spore coat protein n=1 Tax=Tumebacillus flagellatus TaxID=1157490 RepID=UPI0009DDBEB0|nr:spore coat protein [Tumebacillus flagellatus]